MAFADRVGEWYVAQRSERYRKAHGLYLTPVAVADFMASLLEAHRSQVRVLDPAAGAGVLCCAAIEALVANHPRPACIALTAHEVDHALLAPLRTVLAYLAAWAKDHGVKVTAQIETDDFIAAHRAAFRRSGQLFADRPPPCSTW